MARCSEPNIAFAALATPHVSRNRLTVNQALDRHYYNLTNCLARQVSCEAAIISPATQGR